MARFVLSLLLIGIFLLVPKSLHSQSKEVETLLNRMTLAEKIGQMVQINDFNGEISDDLKEKLRKGQIGSMREAK